MKKNVFFYFKKSVAFFDLRVRAIPPAVFISMLALYSLYMYIMQSNSQTLSLWPTQYGGADASAAGSRMQYPLLLLSLLLMLLINAVSYVYLAAAVKEAKNEEYTANDCIRAAMKNFVRLTGVTILKNMVILLGLTMFIIPGIYFAIILIFAECAVLDKNRQTLAGLKYSYDLTAGRRMEIFKIELFCNLIVIFFVILMLNIFATNNIFVFQYIFIFLLSMCSLIEHKLIAYLYVDALVAAEGESAIAVNEPNKAKDDGGGPADLQ